LTFRRSASPTSPPEARWQQTKQKLVSCSKNRTDTAPCVDIAERTPSGECPWCFVSFLGCDVDRA
jgi:hypothetical protein